MTEARKRNLLQLNLDKVSAHSPAGRRFVEKYTKTVALADRQALMNNAIVNGYLMEESGLFTLLRVLDTEDFASMERTKRNSEILRGAAFFAGLPTANDLPAANKPVALTIETLERELLDDNGLLASVSAAERAALLEKVMTKYGVAGNEPPATETSLTAPAEKSEDDSGAPVAAQATSDSKHGLGTKSAPQLAEGESESSLPLANKKNARNRVFKGA